jgi:O-antigen ligase
MKMDIVFSQFEKKPHSSRLGSLGFGLVCVALVAGWAFTFSYSVLAGLGILVAAGLCTIAFMRPFWLLLPVLLTLQLGEFLNLPVTKDGLPLYLVLLFFAFAIWFVRALATKDWDLFKTPLSKSTHILVLVFWLVMILSLANSSNLDDSLKIIKRFTYCVIFYFFILFNIKDKDQLLRAMVIFVCGSLVAAILGVVEGASGEQLYALPFLKWKSLFGAGVPELVLKVEPQRIAGPTGNSERHTMYMITLIFVSLYLFGAIKSRGMKAFIGGIIVVAAVNIVGAAYKVGIVALGASLVIFCYFSEAKKKWVVLISSLGALVVLGFGVYLVFPDINVERLIALHGEAGEHARLRIRNILIALQMFSHNPIVGSGPNGFINEYFRYALFYPEAVQQTLTAHNLYLQVLVDHGLLGLLVFLSILITVARSLRRLITATMSRHRELAVAILATLCAYALVWLGSSLLLDLNVWLLFAVAGVLERIEATGQSALNLSGERATSSR